MARLRRFLDVLTMFLPAWFVWVMLVRAVEGRGSGYIGCYPVGHHVQSVFNPQPYNTTTVDECLLFCRYDFEKYASILGNLCFCSNSIPDDKGTIEKAENDWCDKKCSGNSAQKCGGRTHYSVFNTTVGICPPLMPPLNGWVSRVLFREGQRVNFSCRPGYSLIGNDAIECLSSQGETGKPIWSGDTPICEASGAWSLEWVRLLIVVVISIVGTFLIILIFFSLRARRCCPKKSRTRTLTTREDFSMPDCAMANTFDSEHSPGILTRSYRSFSFENSSDVNWEDDQEKDDANDAVTTMTTTMGTAVKSRLKALGKDDQGNKPQPSADNSGPGSSQKKGGTNRINSFADILRPSFPGTAKQGTEIASSCTSTKPPNVPQKPSKLEKASRPNVEYTSIKPRCKSAYIPNTQKLKSKSVHQETRKNEDVSQDDDRRRNPAHNQHDRKSDMYCNTAEIASRWRVKQSLQLDQDGDMEGTGSENVRSRPAVMPRPKLPKSRYRECFSMQELD